MWKLSGILILVVLTAGIAVVVCVALLRRGSIGNRPENETQTQFARPGQLTMCFHGACVHLTQVVAHLNEMPSEPPRHVSVTLRSDASNFTRYDLHTWELRRSVAGRHDYTYSSERDLFWFEYFCLDITAARSAARKTGLVVELIATVDGRETTVSL
jgi:hypothetical protein